MRGGGGGGGRGEPTPPICGRVMGLRVLVSLRGPGPPPDLTPVLPHFTFISARNDSDGRRGNRTEGA